MGAQGDRSCPAEAGKERTKSQGGRRGPCWALDRSKLWMSGWARDLRAGWHTTWFSVRNQTQATFLEEVCDCSGGGMWLISASWNWVVWLLVSNILLKSSLYFQQSFRFHRKFIATLGKAVAANLWNDTTMDPPSRDPNHSAASRPLKSWKDSWRMHRRRCWWQFPKGDWTLDGTGYTKNQDILDG